MAVTAVGTDGRAPAFAAVVGDGDKRAEEELKQQDVEAGTSAGAATATAMTPTPTPDYAFYTGRCCKSFTALLVLYIAVLIVAAVLAGALPRAAGNAYVTADLVRSPCGACVHGPVCVLVGRPTLTTDVRHVCVDPVSLRLPPHTQGLFVLCVLPPIFFMDYMHRLFPKVQTNE